MIATIYNMFGYFIQNNIPEIKNYSLYNNQIFNQDNDRPRPYPAIFLEILPITTNQLLQQVQEMEVNVVLHIVDTLVDSSDWKDLTNSSTSNHFMLLDKVYRELGYISSLNVPDELINGDIIINSIMRSGINISKSFGHLQDSTINFKFKLFDKTNFKVEYDEVVEDIESSIEISKII